MGESGCLRVFILNMIFLILSAFMKIYRSTAQGGGGSFKNRKPIVEVDCCESRMAEQRPKGG